VVAPERKRRQMAGKKSIRKKTGVRKTAAKRAPKVARGVKNKKVDSGKKKYLRILSAGLGLILTLLAADVGLLMFFRAAITEPMEYTIGRGASVSSVARDLDLGDDYKFLVWCYGGRVLAGTYDLPAGASAWRVARMTTRGAVASVSVTVPEGLTVKQIAKLLNDNKLLAGGAVSAKDLIEGSLFPSTYTVPKGAGRGAVLELMRKEMERIRAEYEKAPLPPPLKDWNEVVILASIVQKETAKVSEMPLVASVYLNRLNKRMRLQACPTVVYAITDGLGDMGGRRLLTRHLRADSRYNTYRNPGLPPMPIANVGLDAIRAVLRPAETEYYYFVADGSGGHAFSKTLAEHDVNHEAWRKIRDGD